jgi:simple sugar transport system ATP-binding protein
MMENHILEMKNISMEFPGVKALKNVDFSVQSGEVRAVVGANGAGKSTLMKVLAGANEGYTGDILMDGRHCEIRNPISAKALGIEIVYQEVDIALFPHLTVAENIMFNTMVRKMKGRAMINWKTIRKSAKEVLARLHIEIDVNKLVSKLPLAQKQMVLIARAVREDCRFLILDEPTAPLSMAEVDELFRIVKELSKKQNVGIIFISHRLPELFQICDTFTVMRDGQIVANKKLDNTVTTQEIVNLMLGRSFEENFPKRYAPIRGEALRIEGLSDREGKVRDVSLHARCGEVVGISGLVGAGKSELCKLIFGANKASAGTIEYMGEKTKITSPTAAVKNKIALIPEERRREGVLLVEPVYFNLSAACLNKFTDALSFVHKRAELKNARRFIEHLGIKTPSEYQKVKYLSGGNQQKVAVGKWLAADASIYIMDEPTKGIDVGAKRDIFEIILKLAEEGKCIVYASSEISEILAITDRTYVMYNGEIAAELVTADTSEEEILYYSAGGKK